MNERSCPKCGKPVVRRVMTPLVGEARRVEWACKCEFTAGAAVEWGPRSAAHDAAIGSFSTARTKPSAWRLPDPRFVR